VETLVLKVALAPVLVVGVTRAKRRWGSRVGGMLIALPVVAGPILLVITLEHGEVFGRARHAAHCSGSSRSVHFCVAFARFVEHCVAVPLGPPLGCSFVQKSNSRAERVFKVLNGEPIRSWPRCGAMFVRASSAAEGNGSSARRLVPSDDLGSARIASRRSPRP
jgi:hypothetical protein